MRTQAEKALAFRDLHQRDSAFIIPNPFDVGSALLLQHLGFEALATSSAGHAYSFGRPDGGVSREEVFEHARLVCAATDLPVSADMENGFGEDLKAVEETYRLAAVVGLAGASIEDVSHRPEAQSYEISEAADRVRAAVAAVRNLGFPFTITARCENYLVGKPDLADTIRRLQAYQEAGADVLFAPGLASLSDIAELVRSVDRPVNVIMGLAGVKLTLNELSAVGVKRISVGSSLARVAYSGFMRAAQSMQETGSFGFADGAVSYREFNEIFSAY
ncbi:MAG: isocitrate lyase/phosphoenolpyruvate mutase family protein [Armatimonadetes bacterium]|nr:isocitrate lyase/phosphoenolpyruvate mutase family protein [Armatimonadota bacterium]